MLAFLKRALSNKQTPEVMKAASEFVQQELQANKVVVFSKSYCPYCTQAKEALNAELGRGKYKVIELENRSDCSAIQDHLRDLTGARSVPRVFIGGKCIGGGTETAQLRASGQLKKLLQALGLL